MMKYFILTLVMAAVAHAKTFNVTEQNTTCLLLSLDGTVDLTLHEKASKSVSLSFDSAELLESNCTVIKLNLTQSVEVWFQFIEAPEPGLWSVEPVTWFSPHAVFPDEVNQTGEVEYKTTPLGHFRKNVSYTCNSKSELSFSGSTPGFNISVTATIANFEIQSLKGKEFVPGEKCDKDVTTAAPATTAVPVTTPKPNTTQDFTCESGNVTRFRLTGSFRLSITYNTTSHKQATVPIDLYKATDVNTSCSSNTTEVLTFRFFKGWSIEYVFERETETPQKYHISNITVTFVHDDHLPNTTSLNVTETVRYTSNNYLEAPTNGYYYCKSKIHLKINEVEITTTNFKYKAFNDGTKGIDFNSGEVTECSADEETSSVVPIAVGAALAGLVVIVLIAYLIGRRRSRKAGYESV